MRGSSLGFAVLVDWYAFLALYNIHKRPVQVRETLNAYVLTLTDKDGNVWHCHVYKENDARYNPGVCMNFFDKQEEITQQVPPVDPVLPTETSISGSISAMGGVTAELFSSRSPELGQKPSEGSSPVVIASDQSTLSVTGSVSVTNFAAVQPISAAALPLPTGASSAELQVAGFSAINNIVQARLSEATFTSRVPTLGQKTSANSSPVVLSSDHGPVTVTGAVSISGGATELTLASRLSEATFTTRTPTLGRKSSAGSVPVVLSSDHGPIPVAGSMSVSTGDNERASFIVLSPDVPLRNDRSLCSLANFSGSDVIVKVHSVYIVNSQNSSITGVYGIFQLNRCSGHSGGYPLYPQSLDTTDTLSSYISARATATISNESPIPLWHNEWSTDEWIINSKNASPENYDHAIQSRFPMWQAQPGTKPLVLRAGEGISVKFTTNSSVGMYSVRVVFTQE